ncbi:ATP-binding protein [Candidatus Micrarchaeota archaeon]|nr:ATP-binding protein [Candidatus Micrarchaeota archaeon]
MYFDTEPKMSKGDFFNYENEYGELIKALNRKDRTIFIVGVRRVGKTSLLNIVYNESKSLKIWIDGRIVSEPKKEIFAAIYEAAKLGKSKIFGKIESLNVSAFGVGFDIKVGSETSVEIEKKIRSAGHICVFIDEAQRMKRDDLAATLSYFYDRFPEVSFIISGSEVGLVEEIIGEDDAEHPLYGRSIIKIVMERLDKNRAFEFLKKGFAQAKFDIKTEEIEEAIAELDGLIGWLTLYGYEKGVMKNRNALKKTTEMASRIAASELLHFFKNRKNQNLYITILRNATGISSNELKARTSKGLGKQINSNLFAFAMRNLMNYSFVEKKNEKYYLSDPLTFKATFLL